MTELTLVDALSQTPTIPLYHYTTQSGFMGILRNREIWATHTQYLNDRREYLHAVDLMRERIDFIEKITEPSERDILSGMARGLNGIESLNICVCSFSEERDSLSQWRAYGEQSSGFAIGFSGAFLSEVATKQKWHLAPCIYNLDKQIELIDALILKIYKEKLEWNKSNTHISDPFKHDRYGIEQLHKYAPILKDSSFRDEREWRLISPVMASTLEKFDFREGNSMLIPFYKFPLTNSQGLISLNEIVIGPTPHPKQSMGSVRTFLARCSQYHAPIESSKVPYRSW